MLYRDALDEVAGIMATYPGAHGSCHSLHTYIVDRETMALARIVQAEDRDRRIAALCEIIDAALKSPQISDLQTKVCVEADKPA